MTFYETDIFTEQIVELIDDDSYAKLQSTLIADPEAGDLMPRSRGLRKVRWKAPGRGKRGGIRVIYWGVQKLAKCPLHFPSYLEVISWT